MLATYSGLLELSQEGSFQHVRYRELLRNVSSDQPCPLCVVLENIIAQFARFMKISLRSHVELRMEKSSDGSVMDFSRGLEVGLDGSFFDQKIHLLANDGMLL